MRIIWQMGKIVRKNGPFAYNIIFSMDKRSFSDSAGKIYCAALKANPQAVAFCKSFGPAEITANDEWVRHIIQQLSSAFFLFYKRCANARRFCWLALLDPA